ncbi:hypothetical protein EKO23_13990 [Nocardioides guangzhouensis]|uniref:Uncharacterized protein n=1 Tax=Nocardioides guangzhouensis TaxID=2497878 RepID=A0A4Q4ZCQ7_9ACTN|nr:hypothetical protein [Nocardioides guangzhouensis]RYP85091.1 hypothetical protein EKO23_13990 [Nocardioides guangzhouensis]
MYRSKDARELAILMRISRELDVVGDLTATVDNPSELLAWALILSQPAVLAWRATDSGHRYLHVTADRSRPPIRGRITAVLACDQHPDFWDALGLDGLASGDRHELTVDALSSAWAIMPVTSPDADKPTAPQPPDARPA